MAWKWKNRHLIETIPESASFKMRVSSSLWCSLCNRPPPKSPYAPLSFSSFSPPSVFFLPCSVFPRKPLPTPLCILQPIHHPLQPPSWASHALCHMSMHGASWKVAPHAAGFLNHESPCGSLRAHHLQRKQLAEMQKKKPQMRVYTFLFILVISIS